MNQSRQKSTWGIIGLGWLGDSLAKNLKALGHPTWGTHRSDFSFESGQFPQTFCDVLFLNTPPLIHIQPKDFAQKIILGQKSRLIFVSSTGVYGSNHGRVTEATLPLPNTDSGRWLLETETLLRSRFEGRLSILRPGGLIGGKRHPVFSLSGRRAVVGAKSPINLIHRDDLIEIIKKLESVNGISIINAVAPFHPTKEDYYSAWADKLSLQPINFSNEKASDRWVDSDVLGDIYKTWQCPRLDEL